MNKRIILFIFLLALLLLVAFFVFQKNKDSLWKTYSNENLGIEFKYPLDWNIEERKISVFSPSKNDHLISVKGETGEVVFQFGEDACFNLYSDFFHHSSVLAIENVSNISNKALYRGDYEEIVSKRDEELISEKNGNENWYSFFYYFYSSSEDLDTETKKNCMPDYFQNYNFSISGGFNKKGDTEKDIRVMDSIVESLILKEPLSGSVETEDIEWQKYENGEYGFSFHYPQIYSSFSQAETDTGLLFSATTTEMQLANGVYLDYPDINVSIVPMEDYFFSRVVEPPYRYDTKKEKCVTGVSGNFQEIEFNIFGDNWKGCSVSTGDANYSNRGYIIPHKEDEVIIEISMASNQWANINRHIGESIIETFILE